jgi:hypothetical protein
VNRQFSTRFAMSVMSSGLISKRSWRMPHRPGRGWNAACAFPFLMPVRGTNPSAGRKFSSMNFQPIARSHRSFG